MFYNRSLANGLREPIGVSIFSRPFWMFSPMGFVFLSGPITHSLKCLSQLSVTSAEPPLSSALQDRWLPGRPVQSVMTCVSPNEPLPGPPGRDTIASTCSRLLSKGRDTPQFALAIHRYRSLGNQASCATGDSQ
ncbi:hypothetical protein ElyMa_002645600 [Elysia marginata]|uniref:Uncharacterized protein n=1 Tax=Elysia marginata TaxID=1093978 RepID=A0AAV4H8U7_9GAST|nr:hypothetical protein ElyMa_002645600 [Elysia marginata]